jgi:RecA-family ATPase
MVFGENIYECNDLFYNPLPSVEYLVDELVQKQGLNYLVGLPETFKTSFALMIAIQGAIGKDVLRFKTTHPFNSFFIDEENGIVGTKMKFKQLVKGLDVDIAYLKEKIYFSSVEGFRIDGVYINTLKLIIAKYQPGLIIIDNIARCLVGDENDVGSVSMIPRLLKPLQEEFGVAFLILHHKRKRHGSDMETTRGSGDFSGQCDIMNVLDVVGTVDGVRKFKLSQ